MVNKQELVLLIESLPQEKQIELLDELVAKGIIKLDGKQFSCLPKQ